MLVKKILLVVLCLFIVACKQDDYSYNKIIDNIRVFDEHNRLTNEWIDLITLDINHEMFDILKYNEEKKVFTIDVKTLVDKYNISDEDYNKFIDRIVKITMVYAYNCNGSINDDRVCKMSIYLEDTPYKLHGRLKLMTGYFGNDGTMVSLVASDKKYLKHTMMNKLELCRHKKCK